MADLFVILLSLGLSIFSTAKCEDIRLPQGNNISLELFQKLQLAHGVALNQKAQEELFLSLPLRPANQTSKGVDVANMTVSVSTPPEARPRDIGSVPKPKDELDRRATTCNYPITEEGQDRCTGQEKVPGFVPCDQPCKYNLPVSQQSDPALYRTICDLLLTVVPQCQQASCSCTQPMSLLHIRTLTRGARLCRLAQ
jgi:hypothetical protein